MSYPVFSMSINLKVGTWVHFTASVTNVTSTILVKSGFRSYLCLRQRNWCQSLKAVVCGYNSVSQDGTAPMDLLYCVSNVHLLIKHWFLSVYRDRHCIWNNGLSFSRRACWRLWWRSKHLFVHSGRRYITDRGCCIKTLQDGKLVLVGW